MSKLALFDFDGTITTKDSFVEFIKFKHGFLGFAVGFLLMSPVILLYKTKLIPNWKAKQWVMKYFWSGTELSNFNKSGREFANDLLPGLCRPAAIEQIRKYQSSGWDIYIVSASASNWIAAWATSMNVKLIATNLEVSEGRISGKIAGKNCYGPEKEHRIRAVLSLKDYEEIHAYGDSRGDREMLALANESFYKPFRA